ncbi:MAG TPA: response regulator [bacterium]|nr:response regulator [bacterium]
MEKILIIDDNKEVLGIFEQILVDKGYTVSTAYNGIEGIERFNKDCFDLVIIDINMPGVSGFDVLNNIKHNSSVVPIILMSSDYLPIGPVDVEKLGINAILSKTIDNETFNDVVRSCLYEDKIYTSKIF